MTNEGSPPGFFNDTSKTERYTNPFYGIPAQYIPQTMDHMLWWANHFLIRFPFYRAALSRIANYFITTLNIECDDSEAKKKYKDILEAGHYRQILSMTGLNLLAYSNVFLSINQGFDRFLSCPTCQKISNIEKLNDYEFSKDGRYLQYCPSCKNKHYHEVIDKPSKDMKRVSVTFWNPRDVLVRQEDTTGEAEYYWDIPKDYINKVTQKNNKFFSKKTPKAIYDAIIQNKCLAFNNKNFIHLKLPTPVGIPTEGKSVPLCIHMFDEFFMLKILERYNQAICMEDIVPFRVFALSSDGNPQNNSVLHQDAGQWNAAIDHMVQEHRQDPGSYHKFPFPLGYQQLGGDAKTLVTVELIQLHIANLLNALNIPQELYTMNLQTQAIGPALRLFENSWSPIVSVYNDVLNHWGEVYSKISGLPKAKISLTPVTLADDIERKSIIGQLVAANAIARSSLLELYGFDYRTQMQEKMKEDEIAQELQDELTAKKQLSGAAQNGSGEAASQSPNDILSQAQEIAQQLFPLDGAQRRQKLQEIKAQNATLYSAVKQALEEYSASSKSNGLQAAKQQGGPSGQQPRPQ